LSFDTLIAWMSANKAAAMGFGALSVLMFLGTVALVPVLVARIPPDYFVHTHRARDDAQRHPVVRHLLVAAKNLLGVVLVLAGVAMLVLPGQGLLTILVGVMLTDFPGKFRLERRLVSRPAILQSINWVRRRARQPPLLAPADDPPAGP
jgi:hypothetical protein